MNAKEKFHSYKAVKNNLPLKLGIHRKLLPILQARCGATEDEVRQILAEHCSSPAYLRNLAKGGPRYTLKGTATAQRVTPDEKRSAKEKLGIEVRPKLSLNRRKNGL